MNGGSPGGQSSSFSLPPHQTLPEESQIQISPEADDKMGVENGGSFPEFLSSSASQSEALQTKKQNGCHETAENGYHSKDPIQNYNYVPPTSLKAQNKPVVNEKGTSSEHRHRKTAVKDQIIDIESVHPKCNREAKLESLEQHHVHDVYEKTAHHFKDIRLKAWPKVKQFLLDLEPGSIVADIGCGHGKYLHINKNIFTLGSDRSTQLIDIARKHNHEVMVCDNLHLPYRSGTFDAVISIGVIHHLTSSSRRAACVKEMARILRPGGKLMCYVWAMEQRTRKFKSQDVLVPWHLRLRPHGKEAIRSQDPDLSDPETDEPIRSHKTRSHHKKSDQSKSSSVQDTSDLETKEKDPKDSPSIPELIKSRLLNFFGSTDEENPPKESPETPKDISKAEKVKLEYQRLFEQVLQEDIENLKRHKPVLEHSMSAPEVEGFAVREFPQSSQPRITKFSSVDSQKDISQPLSPLPCSSSISVASVDSSQQDSPNGHVTNDHNVLCDHNAPSGHNAPSEHNVPSAVHHSTAFSQASQDLPCVDCDNVESKRKVDTGPEPKNSLNSSQCISECATKNPTPTPSPKFTIGGSTSDGEEDSESWMHATSQAIKTVESQVERKSAKKYNQSAVATNGSNSNPSSQFGELAIVHRNGSVQIINGKGHQGHQSGVESEIEDSPVPNRRRLLSCQGSSVSSLSSDNGLCSETDTDDLASFFDTDKDDGADGDSVFEDKPVQNGANGQVVIDNARSKSESEVVREKVLNDTERVFKSDAVTKSETNVRAKSESAKEVTKEQEDKELYKRFYHVFKEGELRELIEKNVECLHIIDSYYDHANWCVVAEKIHVWKI